MHFFLNKRGRFLRHRSQQVFKDQETPRTYRTLEARTQDYISVDNLGIRWTLCVRKFKWCTAFMRALQWCSCLSHECFCKISVNQCFTKLHLNGIVPVVCHHYPIWKEKTFFYVWEIRRKNYKQPLWCQSDGVEKEWIQRRWRSKPPLILLRNFNCNEEKAGSVWNDQVGEISRDLSGCSVKRGWRRVRIRAGNITWCPWKPYSWVNDGDNVDKWKWTYLR